MRAVKPIEDRAERDFCASPGTLPVCGRKPWGKTPVVSHLLVKRASSEPGPNEPLNDCEYHGSGDTEQQ